MTGACPPITTIGSNAEAGAVTYRMAKAPQAISGIDLTISLPGVVRCSRGLVQSGRRELLRREAALTRACAPFDLTSTRYPGRGRRMPASSPTPTPHLKRTTE